MKSIDFLNKVKGKLGKLSILCLSTFQEDYILEHPKMI